VLLTLSIVECDLRHESKLESAENSRFGPELAGVPLGSLRDEPSIPFMALLAA
jgi:hypothetical protein